MKENSHLFERVPAFFLQPFWGYVPAILFAIGSLILAVRYIGSALDTRFSKTSESVTELTQQAISPAAKPKDRIFVDVTPEFLVGLKGNRSTAEGARLLHPYVGKWMKISGPIADVSPPDLTGRPSVVIRTDETDLRVAIVMYFDIARWEHISMLQIGRKISVQGEISTVQSNVLLLVNCELIQDN